MSVFTHYHIRDIYKTNPVTTLIFIANTVMLFLVVFDGGFNGLSSGFVPNPITDWGAIIPRRLILEYPGYFQTGEYYRLFTGMFLHGSFMHYLFNVIFGILIISAGLEKLIGSWRFAAVYFGGGLLSSLSVYFLASGPTIGASGAIFAAVGALLYIALFKEGMLEDNDKNYIYSLLIINIIFTVAYPDISISGHIGGLISGFVLGYLVLLIKRRRRGNWYRYD